ncbi:MAG: phage tail protein [Robiginitomaculum sp.]|nr:phage tail protein [Robiginitomaculum sp.]
MAEYGFVPTNVGLAQEINQALLEKAVKFTHVAFGDGDNNLSPAQTALVNERTRRVVNDIKAVPGDRRTYKIECAIPPDVGGFSITEAGLFDEFGNLCYVAKYTGTYKPLLAEGASEDFLVVLYITVSDVANI